jgi:hypothetical protein
MGINSMPTKKNISLRPEDIALIIELRELIEKKNERLSLAEVVRKSLKHSKFDSESFIHIANSAI